MTRTKINRRLLATVAVTALTAATLSAADRARDRPGGMRPPPPPPPLALVVERHADELGLDAATLDRVRALDREARARADARHEELREARESLHALMESEDPDEAAAVELVERLGEMRTQDEVARVRTDLAVRALLTSEQFARLREMRPPRPEGRPQGGGQRGFGAPSREQGGFERQGRDPFAGPPQGRQGNGVYD